MNIKLTLNNRSVKLDIPSNQTLSTLLRAQSCWSVKHGCENGRCGQCTVSVDGKGVYSCIMLAAQAEGKWVETFESIRDVHKFSALQEVLMDNGDMDCGYCIPGMMMALKTLLDKNREPVETDIIDALMGTTCHCVAGPKPVEAILEAVKKMEGDL